MDAITILKRCRAAQEDMEQLRRRIEQRRGILDGMGAQQADPGGNPARQRMAASMAQLEGSLAARRESYEAEKVAVCALIDTVPSMEGQVLYDYYVRRWVTSEIARKENYTEGYVRKAKRNGERLLDMLTEAQVDRLLPPWYLKEKGGEEA
jgi:hypothetical protein